MADLKEPFDPEKLKEYTSEELRHYFLSAKFNSPEYNSIVEEARTRYREDKHVREIKILARRCPADLPPKPEDLGVSISIEEEFGTPTADIIEGFLEELREYRAELKKREEFFSGEDSPYAKSIARGVNESIEELDRRFPQLKPKE